MIEVKDVDGAGRGYFARATISPGSTVLPGCGGNNSSNNSSNNSCNPVVWAVNDEHERRNCRQCLQPVTAVPIVAPNEMTVSPTPGSANRAPATVFPCPKCLRSVLCSACRNPITTIAANTNIGTTTPPSASAEMTSIVTSVHHHDQLECESLSNLSNLQRSHPDLAESLLGGNTVYLRLLLKLLAVRAQSTQRAQRPRVRTPQSLTATITAEHHSNTSTHSGNTRDNMLGDAAEAARDSLRAVDGLEDHLDDLLDGGEMEARVMNTVSAAKMVVPAVWKASQEDCARFLGQL